VIGAAGEGLRGLLERRSPGAWELYSKAGESRDRDSSSRGRREAWRREQGWAARWWEGGGGPRFACASEPDLLVSAIAQVGKLPARAESAPRLPDRQAARPMSQVSVAPPPDLFERVSQLVSEKSRGEAVLAGLSLSSGRAVEEIANGAGLSVLMQTALVNGVARAVGRRGPRACETRALFRWDGEPDVESLARRLADGATFPLAARGAPFPRGEWLLDPAVAAAILAALAPLFSAGDALPRWIKRGELASRSVTVVDDACADAPFDGEGTPTRRIVLVEDGALRSRLHDMRSAARAGDAPTGHGVRPSYRRPPRPGPRRLFLESSRGEAPRDLLAGVGRGLFASAVTAPVFMDLERDRYEVEFTGVAILAGRASEPVAGARAAGRLSDLLHRIAGAATDRQFFPMPYPVGAPTILVERVSFE